MKARSMHEIIPAPTAAAVFIGYPSVEDGRRE